MQLQSRAFPGPDSAGRYSKATRHRMEMGLGIAAVAVVMLLVVPLPAWMLDLLITLSIAASIVVLLITLQTRNSREFSVFPTLILLLTLFRFGLNVSSTKLILAEAKAGAMIKAFGDFVVGGNYVVGLVVFLVLAGLNFIIAKGAGRIAEVGARFALDAMPGKQMAVDGDLNAGHIDEATARQRREEIAQSAEIAGALDGATKFVQYDAIAGLLITFINILGGIVIGVMQKGMPLADAGATYTTLTVGDGLVTMIPSMLISVSTGIMVSRDSSDDQMGTKVAHQIGNQPRALWIASGVLCAFAIIPGLPTLPFLSLGAGAALLARSSGRAQAQHEAAVEEAERAEVEAVPEETPIQKLLQIDPLELEIGVGLIDMVEEDREGDLVERITLLREQAALEIGILIPNIRIRDNLRLQSSEYVVKLRGSEVARGEILPNYVMAIDNGKVIAPLEGIATVDPSFGYPALWIPREQRSDAEAFGYTIAKPSMVMCTHLMEVLKTNGADLLGLQEARELIDALKRTHPALIEEVVPAKVSLGILHRVLQRLLKERVPIRDLVTILEALNDKADQVKDPEALTEHVRRSLSNVIARQYMDVTGTVRGITLGPRLEAVMMKLFSPLAAQQGGAVLSPDMLARMLAQLRTLTHQHPGGAHPTPVITPPQLRTGIRRLIDPVMPGVPVVSLYELPPQVNVDSIATWDLEPAPALAMPSEVGV